MRGIDFIQIPTTLLSQVDSQLGKNCNKLKIWKKFNWNFYQPKSVLISLNILKSFHKTNYCGYAEILKYSLIRDNNFFLVKKNGQKLFHLKRQA